MPSDDRDAAFKERELDLRAQEVELKRTELRRSRWINPLMFALLAATVAAFANIWVASYNGSQQRVLEAEKADRTLVLTAIGPDTEKTATNLDFLIQAGLYSDPGGKVRKFLDSRRYGEGPTQPVGSQTPTAFSEAVLFDNWNKDAVASGPTYPTLFRIPGDYLITHIVNYHWNGGSGKPPGSIQLRREEDGKLYPVCGAATASGQGGATNVNWFCQPNIVIPGGIYEVIDSDPATWSQNGASGGRGFSRVRGHPAG